MRPLHAALLLVAVVFLGGALGWWITEGALVDAPRVELEPTIRALPATHELPELSSHRLTLEDHIVTPGGPVWLALASHGNEPGLMCRFDRRGEGGIAHPVCQTQQALDVGARFVLGGAKPVLMLPNGEAPLGVQAFDGLSGRNLPSRKDRNGIAVDSADRTRLVRRFAAEAGSLTQKSPTEGAYIGPHTAYAIIAPPKDEEAPPGAFICATPTGYVRARWSGEKVVVGFSANTDETRQVETAVPPLSQAQPSFSCSTHFASFVWLEPEGRLSRLRCDPSGCRRRQIVLEDISSKSILTVREVGEHVVVVYERDARVLVRLGPFAELRHSPSGPVFEAGASRAPFRAEDLEFVPTGQSLLVLVQTPTPRAVQIHENGTLEALRPR